jgi:AcrR family transcriptional regulator
MPKAFSDEDKERIRGRLLEAGRKRFTRYGVKKTTIEELAGAAGIAKGSFYLFFDSKEDLYVELLARAMPEVEKRVYGRSLAAADDPREAIVRFQQEIVREMEEDELIRRLVTNPEELEHLIHSAPGDDAWRWRLGLFPAVLEWVQARQERGEIVAEDAKVVASILGMIQFLPTHEDDLDPEIYPRLMKLMVQVIADGLTCPARKARKG